MRKLYLLIVAAIVLALPYLFLGREPLHLDDATRAQLPGSFLRCSDGYVHYTASGAGPTLVLLHGGLDSYPVFDRLVAALPGHRIVRFDFYGQGYSDRPGPPYDLPLFEREVQCVADHFRLDRFDLAGWSLGGLVASAYAADHPERVRTVTVIAPAGVNAHMSSAVKLAALPVAGEYVTKLLWPGLVRNSIEGPSNRRYSPGYIAFNAAQQQRYLTIAGTRATALSLIRDTPSFRYSDTWSRLGRTGLPVLLLYGDHDATVTPAVMPRLRRDIPNLTAIEIEGASHGLIWDCAETIASALRTSAAPAPPPSRRCR